MARGDLSNRGVATDPFAYTPPSGPSGPVPFSVNPTPQAGTSAFGMVPGPVGLPSPSADLSALYPNLSATNAAASQGVLARLRGELSPGTINAIQDASARFGVTSGMPGSGLQRNKGLRDLGLTSEAVQRGAIGEYGNLAGTISGTQTVRPETQIGLAEQNALNAAAPNPQAAATYAQSLFDKYMSSLRGSSGGGWIGDRPAPMLPQFGGGYTPPRDTGFGATPGIAMALGTPSNRPVSETPYDPFAASPWQAPAAVPSYVNAPYEGTTVPGASVGGYQPLDLGPEFGTQAQDMNNQDLALAGLSPWDFQ